MYTHPFFEATPPGAAPGTPVKTGARVRRLRGCNKEGCTTDARAARMCGGVAAATGIFQAQVKVQLE